MLVRMKTNITGYRNEEPWPEVGETIDVPEHEAEQLIANGYAEPATAAEAGAGESARDDTDNSSNGETTVPDGDLEEILAWVDGDPGRAQLALDTEDVKRKPRKQVTAALREVIDAAANPSTSEDGNSDAGDDTGSATTGAEDGDQEAGQDGDTMSGQA